MNGEEKKRRTENEMSGGKGVGTQQRSNGQEKKRDDPGMRIIDKIYFLKTQQQQG